MDQNNSSSPTDALRVKYGFWVVIVGLALVCAVFIFAIFKWSTAADVATAVGSFTGVVGTIIGAFFGIQVGSAGKEKAEADRAEAQKQVVSLAAELPPEKAEKVMSRFQ